MGAPAQSKTFLGVAYEFHLRVNMTRGYAWMFCSIPNHNSPICAHCGDDVRVLRLVPSFVHLSLMVDLLHHVEFDLHDWCLFPSSTSITSNLLPLLIVFIRIWRDRLWKLHVSYLQVILSLVGSVRAYEKSVSRVVFIRSTIPVNSLLAHGSMLTYDCLSGSHCVVSVGHSNAVLSITSYRNGAFFFQVLYSSFTIFSSSRSSSCSSSSSAAQRS